MKHITRTWLCLNPFRQLKSTYSLQDSISHLHSCKNDTESVICFLLTVLYTVINVAHS